MRHRIRSPIALAVMLLLALFTWVEPSWSQPTYTIGDMGSWNYSQAMTGFGWDYGSGSERGIGQTFSISAGNAALTSITVPIYWNSYQGYGAQWNLSVAAWNGTQPTTSLYSTPLFSYQPVGWQMITVQPASLVLNQGQTYFLELTPSLSQDSFDAEVGYALNTAFPGGQAFFAADVYFHDPFSQPWNLIPPDVMAFSINYQLVPEPSGLALLGLAALPLSLRWWSKKQSKDLSR